MVLYFSKILFITIFALFIVTPQKVQSLFEFFLHKFTDFVYFSKV